MRIVGSSAVTWWRALPILSRWLLVFGGVPAVNAGGGKAIGLSVIGFSLVLRVSFVCVFWSLTTAPISPAGTSVADSCILPRIRRIWPMRSSVLVRAFQAWESDFNAPL